MSVYNKRPLFTFFLKQHHNSYSRLDDVNDVLMMNNELKKIPFYYFIQLQQNILNLVMPCFITDSSDVGS